MLAGLAVGWTVHTDLVSFLPGWPCSWPSPTRWPGSASGWAWSVPTVEVAQQVSFTVLFPITFVSGVFVPIATMPTWLQPFAYWNPVTTLASSLRNLWGNPNPFPGSSLASTQPILVTLGWFVVILACSGRWASAAT